MLEYGVKFRDQKPEEVTVREWNNYGREAHKAAGEYWQTVLLPRHFTPEAKGRYHHQPRTRGYTLRKIRLASIGKAEGGGLIDNLFSGLMLRLLKSTAGFSVYPSRVTVQMVGPRYVTMRSGSRSTQPDKAAEIKRDTPDEVSALFGIVDRVLTERINEKKQPLEVDL